MKHLSVAELAVGPARSIVDVREPFEFAAGHDAVNVDGGTSAWAASGLGLDR